MIEKLLPAPVIAVASIQDAPDSSLHPAEAKLVARAVAKRRREFTTVRHCARQALTGLGVAPAPILTGPRGEPQWPVGVVGSMTHCDGYRAAAVARVADVHTIGIDAEPDQPLPDGVAALVMRPEEAEQLGQLAGVDDWVHWDRLLFSAKEAVYKAWFPLTGRWLDFHQASVALAADGTFWAQLLVPGPIVAGQALAGFAGRWLASDGLVVTAITVPNSTAA